jgi:hypothetical protein
MFVFDSEYKNRRYVYFLGKIAQRKEAFLREQSVKYTKLTKGSFFYLLKTIYEDFAFDLLFRQFVQS